MGTENKVGTENGSLVFYGPETSSVGFVRVTSLACIECVCKGPLSSPQHMVGVETSQDVIGVETSQDGGFEDEIVGFDFPPVEPPSVFHISPETSQPPVSEISQSPYVVKITRSPASATTQSPVSENTQSPTSLTTQSPVSATTRSSISKTTLSSNVVKIITETSQPPVSETTEPPVSETTQSPFVIFYNY